MITNSPFPPYKPLKGIYDGDGTTLQLNAEQELSLTQKFLHFLDVKLSYSSETRRMQYETFDKRENAKFNLSTMTRFTPCRSMIWASARSGAVQSEASRLITTNSTKEGFVRHLACTLVEMYSRSINWVEIERKCMKAIQSHAPDAKIDGRINHVFNAVMHECLNVWRDGHPMLDHRDLVGGVRRGRDEPHVPPPVRYVVTSDPQ